VKVKRSNIELVNAISVSGLSSKTSQVINSLVDLCVDLFVFIRVYFVSFCLILHVLYYCERGGVDLMGLKPNP